MNKVDRFWSHEAQNIRCVRESDYDALAAELATERLRADVAVKDANDAERRGAELEGLLDDISDLSCTPDSVVRRIDAALAGQQPQEE